MFIFEKVGFWCELLEIIIRRFFPPAFCLFEAAPSVQHFAYTRGSEDADVNSWLLILRKGGVLRDGQRITGIFSLLFGPHLPPFILLVVLLLILLELLKLSKVIVFLLIITHAASIFCWSRRPWWRTDHMLIVHPLSDCCTRWNRTCFLVRRL